MTRALTSLHLNAPACIAEKAACRDDSTGTVNITECDDSCDEFHCSGRNGEEEIKTMSCPHGITPLRRTAHAGSVRNEDLHNEDRREWGFIVFKVSGHGLTGDIKHGLDSLRQSGTSCRTHITVRAEEHGRISDYAVRDREGATESHLTHAAGGAYEEDAASRPLLSEESIAGFVLNSMRHYPAKHYMVSFEGHSEDLRAALPAVRSALESVAGQSGEMIDVLLFDSCFMSQLEIATEFKDVAKVMAASQEGVVKFRPLEKLAEEAGREKYSPHELARHIVETSEEFSFAAIDLQKIQALNTKMKHFGEQILAVKDDGALSEIRREIRTSSHFSTEGITGPNTFYNAVDLFDFINRLSKNHRLAEKHPTVAAAGREVLQELREDPRGLVIAEKHQSGIDRFMLDYTDVSGAHGLSLFMPTTPKAIRDRYMYIENSQFSRDTGWEKVSDHITGDRSSLYIVGSLCHYLGGLAIGGINTLLYKAWEEIPAVQRMFETS
ncbi:MAG: clostripain-related cysteine peptidase [Candidatus Xenobiia bacterium LiM19]